MSERTRALRAALAEAERFLDGVDERPVGAVRRRGGGRRGAGRPAPRARGGPRGGRRGARRGRRPRPRRLRRARATSASSSAARCPAALAADWLVSAWDQNAGFHVALAGGRGDRGGRRAAGCSTCSACPPARASASSPARQMANFTVPGRGPPRGAARAPAGTSRRDGLHRRAARARRRRRAGARHDLHARCALLGLGARDRVRVRRRRRRGGCVPTRSRRRSPALDGPAIVCAQAGNVNTGAFDPFDDDRRRLRARTAPGCTSTARSGCGPRRRRRRARSCAGVERADSWAVDAHKWLNVPYDCGARDRRRPRAPTAPRWPQRAPYLRADDGPARADEPRARVLAPRPRACPSTPRCASLGRDGVAELVERCCAHARRMAERLAADPGVEVLNDVVLNQVLVRFRRRRREPRARSSPRSSATARAGSAARTWHGRGGDADLGLELVDDRRGRRPLGRGDRGRRWARASGGRRRVAAGGRDSSASDVIARRPRAASSSTSVASSAERA